MIRWVIASSALAACAAIPDFAPSNGVSVTQANEGGTVVGRNFALHFSTSDGAHYPDTWTIGAANVLGHNPAAGCDDADRVGISFAPMPRISSDDPSAVTSSSWFALMTGPAAAKIDLHWSTHWACSPTREPNGRTIFTIFPDGRIMRADEIRDDVATEINPAGCSCSGVLAFLFTSFWTFDTSLFTEVELAGNSTQPIPTATNEISNIELGCLSGPGYHIGYAGPSSNFRASTPSTTVIQAEYTSERPTRLNAFQFDSVSSVVFDTDCDAAMLRADQRLSPPPLLIDDASVMPSEIDGIYGGEINNASGFVVSSDHVKLKGTLPTSFAVQLRFPHSLSALRVEKNGEDVAYIPQRVADNEWLVWFEKGMVSTDVITVGAR